MNLFIYVKELKQFFIFILLLSSTVMLSMCGQPEKENKSQATLVHKESDHKEDEHEEHDESEEEGEHEEKGHIELTPAQIKQSEIKIDQAGPGLIKELLPVYGRVRVNPDNRQVIVARFDGVVTSIHKKEGDSVRKGDALLTVEGNDSFKKYDILSTLNGKVTQRNASIGEQTSGRDLLVVENFKSVWVDLSLFPKDLVNVKEGQMVQVSANNSQVKSEGQLFYVAEFSQSSTQTILARVVLPNENRQWLPGQFVNANIVVSEIEAKVAVRNESIQLVEDNEVIFVKGEEGYEPRPVQLGKSDGLHTEILSGLQAGELYVSGNSFILKSEMGKEDAEHGH